MPRFYECWDGVVDGIVRAVEAWMTEGLPLSEVQAVVRGDRSRGVPPLPAIWVYPEKANYESRTYGEPETWVMPVTLAALVRSDDPEAGGRACARLAAEARRAALVDRQLGLDYVVDTVPAAFDGAARSSERNRTLYWADSQIRVTLTVEEEV
jgi:hypothetical protein